MTAALSRPYMIGYNKCQYVDDPQPKLLKQGLVKTDYTPYSYVEGLKAIHEAVLRKAYSLE